MTGVAFTVGALTNVHFWRSAGKVSIAAAAGDVERIIPMYIKGALPEWFGVLFMLTLLSAAMSTLSSQFHVMGTSLGRDFLEQGVRRLRGAGGVMGTRVGVLLGIVVSVYLGYELERLFGKTGTAIVARGTAIFMGLCACAFLPMYVGALWSKGITRAGAVAGMLAGAVSSVLWMLFVHEQESTALLLCKQWFGVRSLGIRMVQGAEPGQMVEQFIRHGPMLWAYVDPLIIGLPLAALVTILVSRMTRKLPAEHVRMCFGRSEVETTTGRRVQA